MTIWIRGTRSSGVRISTLAAAVLIAISLAGCGEDSYKSEKPYHFADSLPDMPRRRSSVAPAITIPPLPVADLRSDLGLNAKPFGTYSNRDLRDKADVFWKFYWITKALEENRRPPSLNGELRTIEQAIRKMQPDKNTQSLSSILDEIREGLAADDLDQRLSSQGIRVATLPWSGGGYDLSRQLDGTTVKSRVSSYQTRKLSSSDIRLAVDWAARHHKSPSLVKDDSFRHASAMTSELGDALDDERKEAGEHPIGRDQIIPGSAPPGF
jgi:hypothetical protein